MMTDAMVIILTGALVAVSCSLLGSFLVLRKMAMVGDAISHAVLPGIVIAFLVAKTRASLPMMVGAAASGMLATILIEFLHKKARLQNDASIGLVFTFLFAIGVILISMMAGNIDIDQDCVLYGEIAYVPLNTVAIGGLHAPRETLILAANLVLVLLLVTIGYKGLYITTFDPEFAGTLGISTAFWQYLLMAAVSMTTVVSFESVGAILVVGFLIIPAATAYLLTHSLPRMLGLSSFFGILSAIGGYYLALATDGSIAGAMITISGTMFFTVMIATLMARRRVELLPEPG